ncbi:MAG: type 4a pilus biogenesis protein PilO [Myxococcales bacterium]|nr:type 4a pilus biogenesis protein PilO [Myxococcales bacterium]
MALADQLNLTPVLERMETLPAAARMTVLGALFASVVAIYWVSTYSASLSELNTLQQQYAGLQSEIAQSKGVIANLATFERRRDEVSSRLEIALRRLPNSRELPVLLTNITGLGKNAGLEFRSFTPQAERMKEFYAEVPISVEMFGSYHDFGSFFEKLAQHERIVNMTELELMIETPGPNEALLEMRGVATTFRFVENAKTGGE